MEINHSRLTQKNGLNRKLLRSIVSSNPAHSAQSTMDQCRVNSINAHAISTYDSMRFEPKPISKPISSQSHSQRHYTSNFVAIWMQMRTIATKACMKSKRPRNLSGSRSNISGPNNQISSKSKAISAEKREKKTMSNTL